ncbi:MAG: hypothetical protein ACI308_08605 [Muribaculaceae bacterium]
MKKILLCGAAIIMACTMNAQGTITGNLTLDWEHNMADHTGSETRDCGALGTKAILNNKTTGKVEIWGENGYEKDYDVNTWAAENADGLTIGLGNSVDEAGNIIVNLNFGLLNSFNNFIIIDPEGKMTYVPCTVPSGVEFPDGAGRCDYLGDKMAGNMLENGFIVTCPNACAYATVFNIYEGEQDKDFSYGVKIGDEDNTESWNTESSVIFIEPLNADATEAPKMIARNRSIGGLRVNEGGKTSLQKAVYENDGVIDFSKTTTTNWSAFKVNGRIYVVLTQDDDGTRTHSWEVIDFQDATTKARWTMPAGEAVNYQVGFASSVNEDGTVNIFQFNPGIRLAKYTFTPGSTDINSIEADADVNAPVEYYNLQGVKVANPENGIFIKKQGAKATKIIAE